MSQSLSVEVSEFGIKVTLIEPGGFSTDWAGPSAKHSTQNPAYGPVRERSARQREERTSPPGDPAATRGAVLELVDAEKPPLRVFFGDGPLRLATTDYESRLATWREWEPLSLEARG